MSRKTFKTLTRTFAILAVTSTGCVGGLAIAASAALIPAREVGPLIPGVRAPRPSPWLCAQADRHTLRPTAGRERYFYAAGAPGRAVGLPR